MKNTSGADGGSAMRARAGDSEAAAYDLQRLENSTRALVDLCDRLRGENAQLKSDLAEREARLDKLDAQRIDHDRRRAETRKRIDDLVARLEWVDGQLARASAKAAGGGGRSPASERERDEVPAVAKAARGSAPPA